MIDRRSTVFGGGIPDAEKNRVQLDGDVETRRRCGDKTDVEKKRKWQTPTRVLSVVVLHRSKTLVKDFEKNFEFLQPTQINSKLPKTQNATGLRTYRRL